MPQKAVDYSIKESTLSETMKQKMVPLCDVCYARNKAENHFIRSLSYATRWKHTATEDRFCLL